MIVHRRTQRAWNLVFVAVIGALLLIGVATLQRITALSAATTLTERSLTTLRAVDRVLIALLNIETGARGYVLSGRATYLDPYEEGLNELAARLDDLDVAFAGNPEQLARVARLREVADARAQLAARLIETGQLFQPPSVPTPGEGKVLMDQVRHLATEIEAAEVGVLTQRAEAAEAARAASQAIVLTAIVLAAALAGIAVLVNFDANRHQRRLRAEIAERSAAQERVEASDHEFRSIANSMPQFVWTAGSDGRPTYFNDRWFDYTGMARDCTQEFDWARFAHPDDRDVLRGTLAQAMGSGEPFQQECRLCGGEERTPRWFIGRGVPLRSPQGKVERWFGTWTDIDDQKRLQSDCERLLESERIARVEAERASRLKDEFVATVSHELRTPLNAMLGWTRILQRGADEETSVQGLEVIERNVRTQIRLVEDLLDMSRALSGKLHLELEPVDVGVLAVAAAESIRHTAEGRDVRLEVAIAPDCPPTMADSRRVQQIIWNLLSNAVKFTDARGHVRIVLRCDHAKLVLSVADDGRGIAPEFVPYVFDRFRQADGTTTRRYAGLGLGLAIVKHLVELHGGTVSAASDGEGRGATFTVVLPVVPVGAPRAGRASPVGDGLPRLDGLRALVVDDDGDARELVRRLLQERGADVTMADSVDAAMREFTGRVPGLLISDIGMPVRDGIELIREVRRLEQATRADAWGRGVPAIALSALARAEDRQRAVTAGYNVFVPKPVEPNDLIQMAARLTGR